MNNLQIRENLEKKGIELYFDFMPYAKTRNFLKGLGFRWHFSKKCWYNRDNEKSREAALQVEKWEKRHTPYTLKVTEPETTPEEVKEEPEKVYRYGMRIRGFSIGCQPKEGFIQRVDDPTGKYWDIIEYNRELTDEETSHYSLDYLEPEEVKEPEEIREETKEPEKVNDLGINIEPKKAAKRTPEKRSFDWLVKNAGKQHTERLNGRFDGYSYACDGYSLMRSSENLTDMEMEKQNADTIKNIIKGCDPDKEIKISFTAKELKAGISQIKKGKRKATVLYGFDNGMIVNAEFLYNALLATDTDTIYYTGAKSPIVLKNDHVYYMVLPVNNQGKEDKRGLFLA